jgi:hypothetical protein
MMAAGRFQIGKPDAVFFFKPPSGKANQFRCANRGNKRVCYVKPKEVSASGPNTQFTHPLDQEVVRNKRTIFLGDVIK